MKITFYDSPGEAERDLRKKEVEHLVVDHELEAGEEILPDSHEANEWIIFDPAIGKFRIMIGDEECTVIINPNKTTVIHVPNGTVHFLKAITGLSYTVLRDSFS